MAEHDTSGGLAGEILSLYKEVYRTSREGEPLLRYGRRSVPVSTIAQQFYCEKAVQYSIEKPRPPTSAMLSGSAGHEAVSALGVTMTPDEAVAEAVAARERPLCVYEFRIGWRHDGVTILGFVDEAWFQGGAVRLIAERKFSGSPAIHTPYHVQASLYCLGLSEMGFNTDQCRYRISVFQRECHNCDDLRNGACPSTAEEVQRYACERGACTSEEFAFDRASTLVNLNWALGFWTWEREAEPTTHVTRCHACRYRHVCDADPRRSASD